jgi:hypothetical protein
MQTSGGSLLRDLVPIFNVHVQFNPLLSLTAGDAVAKNTRVSMQEARVLHMCFFGPSGCHLLFRFCQLRSHHWASNR